MAIDAAPRITADGPRPTAAPSNDRTLASTARGRSRDVVTRDYFSHATP